MAALTLESRVMVPGADPLQGQACSSQTTEAPTPSSHTLEPRAPTHPPRRGLVRGCDKWPRPDVHLMVALLGL